MVSCCLVCNFQVKEYTQSVVWGYQINRQGEYVTIFYPGIWISGREYREHTKQYMSRMSVAGEVLLISILLATAEQSDRPTDRQRPIREVIMSIDLCQDQHNERPPAWSMGNESWSFVRIHGETKTHASSMPAGKGRGYLETGSGIPGWNNEAANPTDM